VKDNVACEQGQSDISNAPTEIKGQPDLLVENSKSENAFDNEKINDTTSSACYFLPENQNVENETKKLERFFLPEITEKHLQNSETDISDLQSSNTVTLNSPCRNLVKVHLENEENENLYGSNTGNNLQLNNVNFKDTELEKQILKTTLPYVIVSQTNPHISATKTYDINTQLSNSTTVSDYCATDNMDYMDSSQSTLRENNLALGVAPVPDFEMLGVSDDVTEITSLSDDVTEILSSSDDVTRMASYEIPIEYESKLLLLKAICLEMIDRGLNFHDIEAWLEESVLSHWNDIEPFIQMVANPVIAEIPQNDPGTIYPNNIFHFHTN